MAGGVLLAQQITRQTAIKTHAKINQMLANALKTKPTWIRKLRNQWESEALFKEVLDVFSELLSQGEVDSRFSAVDLKKMVDELNDANPSFWEWLRTAILRMIKEYRSGEKKV